MLGLGRSKRGLQLVGLRLVLDFATLAVLALVLLGLRGEDLGRRRGWYGVGVLGVLETHCWLRGGVAVGRVRVVGGCAAAWEGVSFGCGGEEMGRGGRWMYRL